MNREEQFDKNLGLAREFFVGLLDQPLESWPDSGTTVVFTPSVDAELARANISMVETMEERHPGDVMRVTGEGISGPTQARSTG